MLNRDSRARGNMAQDAWLVALALESGGELGINPGEQSEKGGIVQ